MEKELSGLEKAALLRYRAKLGALIVVMIGMIFFINYCTGAGSNAKGQEVAHPASEGVAP